MSEVQPPKWAVSFLRWYCREDYLDEIEGDLFEFYSKRVRSSSRSANLFFVWNVFRSFRVTNFKKTQLINNWTMNLAKNYTKIYFRRFRKDTSHFLVNIIGLSLGFAVLFFILMFVYDEQNIDRFHSKKDLIYRVIVDEKTDDGTRQYISTPGPMAEALKNDFPGIVATAHMSYTGSQVITKGDIKINDREWAFVTKEVFDILDIKIVNGNPKKAFQGYAALVITADVAKRLFGRVDVVGEVVDDSLFGPAEVIAIMEELPINSTYQFKELYVVDYDQIGSEGWFKRYATSWDNYFTMTWLMLSESASVNDVYSGKDAFLEKYLSKEKRSSFDFHLQPLSDFHLGSSEIEHGGMTVRETIPPSSKEFVSIVLLLGFLVIFIASLNYINLSSVQALKRTLEASMRKVNGAQNKHLLGQLFFETLLTVLIAYSISMILVFLLFPAFQHIINKNFGLSVLFSDDFILYHLASILTVWFFSALIPATYYARLERSILILKNAFSGKGDLLRKVLVGIQYALSIFLIIGSMVIYRQLNYVKSKELGFDRSNLITLDINSGQTRTNFKGILNGIRESSNVISATVSSRVPGEWKNIPSVRVGQTLTDNFQKFSHYGVDQYWLETFNISLESGSNFSGVESADSLSIILNQKAVSALGLKEPLGESLWLGSNNDTVRMKVIGVVEDFHFQSLYETIGPVVLTNWHNHVFQIDYFTVRYKDNPKEVLNHIEQVNDTFDPSTPAELNFLNQKWDRFYKAEESRSTFVLIASSLSILISAFGLFGLINFTMERKTKEIGIRKVLGASTMHISSGVLKDYLLLLMLSLLVAIPVSWWVLKDWLANFAYRISFGADLFGIAFGIVLLISFFTVLTHILRISRASPVESMRYE